MIQAMKILQLGTLDLRDRIEQELVENPMLEEAAASNDDGGGSDDDSGGSGEDSGSDRDLSERERRKDSEGDEVRRMLDDLERIERDFGDGRRNSGQGDGEEGDRKLQALANAPSVPKTMAEALSEELAFIELSRRKRAIAEFLIFSLDERGYLPDDLETLAEDCPIARSDQDADEDSDFPRDALSEPTPVDVPESVEDTNGVLPRETVADPAPSESEGAKAGDENEGDSATPTDDHSRVHVEELQWVLDRLRATIHPALGAHDLREALLLQVDLLEGEQQILRTIVSNHLEDVQNNRLPRIAKATGQPLEMIQEVLENLKRLDPTPGAEYGESVATIIVPDVVVEEDEGTTSCASSAHASRASSYPPRIASCWRTRRRATALKPG